MRSKLPSANGFVNSVKVDMLRYTGPTEVVEGSNLISNDRFIEKNLKLNCLMNLS